MGYWPSLGPVMVRRQRCGRCDALPGPASSGSSPRSSRLSAAVPSDRPRRHGAEIRPVEPFVDARRVSRLVDPVMGDGIMALFGAPVAHEDRGCARVTRRCACRKLSRATRRRRAARLGCAFRSGFGLNSGEVVVRAIGSDLRKDYTAVGQTPDLAARMEQLCGAGHGAADPGDPRPGVGVRDRQGAGAGANQGASSPPSRPTSSRGPARRARVFRPPRPAGSRSSWAARLRSSISPEPSAARPRARPGRHCHGRAGSRQVAAGLRDDPLTPHPGLAHPRGGCIASPPQDAGGRPTPARAGGQSPAAAGRRGCARRSIVSVRTDSFRLPRSSIRIERVQCRYANRRPTLPAAPSSPAALRAGWR